MKIIIVGGGVSGVFTSLQLLSDGFNGEDITILEQGNLIENRKCFVDKNTSCKNCGICNITHGIAGCGAFSDSKLNFDEYSRVGGDLGIFYSPNELENLMEQVEKYYNYFGMNNLNIIEEKRTDEANDLIKYMNNIDNLEFHDCRTIHLGTDRSQVIYKNMQDYLLDNGVKIYPKTEIKDMKIHNNGRITLYTKDKYCYSADKVVFAVGRSGNEFLNNLFNKNNIKTIPSKIDIGCRIETTNEVMNKLNRNFYEAKIYLRDRLYNDECRVFCTNPSGIVAHEKWNTSIGNISTVNGHAYANKDLKTNNTNFALLVSKEFNGDIKDPLNDYVFPMIRMANSLAGGTDKVLMQSLKDLKLHRRSTEETIKECNLKPTLKATYGDISLVLPYRILTTILDSIEILDKVVNGLNNGENTFLYAPECKFHSNKILIDKYGKTTNDNVYAIGDGSGYCRGIIQSAVHGILCANNIMNKER